MPGSGRRRGQAGRTMRSSGRGRATPRSPRRARGPCSARLTRALAAASGAEPGAELRWTGIGRFAAASRQRIQREVATLNLLSLGLVAVVAVACVRRVHRAVHLVPVILGSLLGAWTVTAAVWAHVHVLVFVLGSLLAGVAVDYGFYLYLQPRARPDEPYVERAGRLLRPLLASALTTVIRLLVPPVVRAAAHPPAGRLRQRRTALRPRDRAPLVRADQRSAP